MGLHADLDRAVGLLTPTLELRSGRGFLEDAPSTDQPRRLSDLAWPRLTLADRGGASELTRALADSPDPLGVMEIATARLRSTIGLSVDIGFATEEYDATEGDVPSIELHPQNEHHDGPVFLTELLVRLLPRAIATNRHAARAMSSSWRAMSGLLGTRLWLHALRQVDLFTADEAISGIISLSLNEFWGVRSELAVLLRDRSSDASPELVTASESRIRSEGADYYAHTRSERGRRHCWTSRLAERPTNPSIPTCWRRSGPVRRHQDGRVRWRAAPSYSLRGSC